MKRVFSCFLGFAVCVGFVMITLHPSASLAQTGEEWVAKAVSVQGTVELQKAGQRSGSGSS